MNKNVKRILLVVTTIIIVAVLVALGVSLKMRSEIDQFEPMETKELTEKIVTIQDSFVNLFVVKDSLGYIVIDCGIEPKVVSKELSRLQINPDSVIAVLLTHTDSDHVGALNLFTKAKLYLAEEEVQMINGTKARSLIMYNHIDRTDYIEVDDRETIQIGNTNIQAFLTPGHTPGSMSYLIDDIYLFTGDAIGLEKGKVVPARAFFEMDTEQAIKSIDIIRNISGAQYIFTAHYGYTDDYANAIK